MINSLAGVTCLSVGNAGTVNWTRYRQNTLAQEAQPTRLGSKRGVISICPSCARWLIGRVSRHSRTQLLAAQVAVSQYHDEGLTIRPTDHHNPNATHCCLCGFESELLLLAELREPAPKGALRQSQQSRGRFQWLSDRHSQQHGDSQQQKYRYL